ncbi:nucleoside deaminase [Alsobacter sp. R-9]
MTSPPPLRLPPTTRRRWLVGCAGWVLLGASRPAAAAETASLAPFMARAAALRDQAVAAGDQSYGAVLVREGRIVGEGPSAVVTRADPTAHAETEAIRDAVRRAGPAGAAGATLVSTSRPCPMCEANAARAGVARMVYGASLTDAGAPRAR